MAISIHSSVVRASAIWSDVRGFEPWLGRIYVPAILRYRTAWQLKAMPGTSFFFFFKVDGDQLKITLVDTVIHAIFLNTYIAIYKGFFGLSEPGRVRQEIGLWYFSKLIGCLLFNRYFLTEHMSDLFYFSRIKQASPLSMSNSCDTDQTANRQAHNHKI